MYGLFHHSPKVISHCINHVTSAQLILTEHAIPISENIIYKPKLITLVVSWQQCVNIDISMLTHCCQDTTIRHRVECIRLMQCVIMICSHERIRKKVRNLWELETVSCGTSFGISTILHLSVIKESGDSDGKSAWLDIRRCWIQSLVRFLIFQFSFLSNSLHTYILRYYQPGWQTSGAQCF